ncbi:unnamed protein product [Umbelopsis ramanniana]
MAKDSATQREKLAKRRLKQLGKTIKPSVSGWSDSEDELAVGQEENIKSVRIGDVVINVDTPIAPELVPENEEPLFEDSQEVLRHLRWMMQKDKLRQDIFLIGPPGPLRRALVMKYAQLTKREVEYVALSKDVTDADLKQRRELSKGTSYYVDQAAVRAAVHGRILILDGIEKAERNVLPILNNLLENREMALEDGRFLTNKDISSLEASNPNYLKFEKVHDRFLVFALGLPIPRYVGYPLDPPLRSRFQSRDIKAPGFDSQVRQFLTLAGPGADKAIIERLISISMVLGVQSGNNKVDAEIDVPEFPSTIDALADIYSRFPLANLRFLLDLVYPYPLLPTCNAEQLSVIESVYRRFRVFSPAIEADQEAIEQQVFSGYSLANIERLDRDKATVDGSYIRPQAVAAFAHEGGKHSAVVVECGSHAFGPAEYFVETPYHKRILTAMVMAHAGGHDFCLVGTNKGVGKSALIRHFARNLGYSIEFIPLFRDMSSRDLLQRRTTTNTGDTIWENSMLIEAALHGRLAVLDGVETLSFGTLTTLQRLVMEREVQLPDGKRLVNPKRFLSLMKKHNWSQEELLKEKGMIPIHPSFRIVCLARAGSGAGLDGPAGAWLTPEVLTMFHFVVVSPLPSAEEQSVLKTLSPGVDEDKLSTLLKFANRLRRDTDENIKVLSNAMSTRQLIRICRRIAYFPDDCLHTSVHKVSLSRFMPNIARMALDELLKANGIAQPTENLHENLTIDVIPSREDPKTIRIGSVTEQVFEGGDPMLIPHVVFHENPAQTLVLQEMLKDYQLGEHLLLIGNQGVGKNKLADYFLQLLKLPREYIQLHRDSTVQSLTTTPAIRDGVLIYEDSPLVKAVTLGNILVVDEADKAPTFVTAVLKSLIEDGQMVLGDGRRIVSNAEDKERTDDIIIHNNFRMIVLANRPGYPFLGNDFYREIGDVFSCHAVDNPDMASEMYLLKKYGPNVPEDLLEKMSAAFTDLRKLVDEGLISYPYSTRELVNIVRHMQIYPEEGISKTLQNVFDFDQYDQASKDMLIEVFQKHGIPVGLESEFSIELGQSIELGDANISQTWARSPSLTQASQTCRLEEADIAVRGGWDLENGKKWRDLERKEGRSLTFTEQLYHFDIPTRGEALDIAAMDDGSMFIVTTNPVTLHRIEPKHQKIDSLDLYEYFPLQRTPPRLRISVIKQNGHVKYLALHNPSNNELLCCDFNKNSVVSVVIRGLDPVNSIMVRSLESSGILVFYQEDRSVMAVLDFNTSKQYTIHTPIRIKQLFVLEPGFWIAQDSRSDKKFMMHVQNSNAHGIPLVMEQIDVSGKAENEAFSFSQVAHMESPEGRFMHSGYPEHLASVGVDLKSTVMTAHPNAAANIYTYMRRIPLDDKGDLYSNVKSASLYLAGTRQFAVIHPFRDGRSEGVLELINADQNRGWRIHLPLAYLGQPSSEVPTAGFVRNTVTKFAASLCELPNGQLVTMDNAGTVRVWQVDSSELFRSAQTWKRMVGVDQKVLSVIFEKAEDGQENNAEGVTMVNADGQAEGGDGSGSGSGEGSGEGDGSGGSGGSGEGGSGGGTNMNENGREATFVDVSTLELRAGSDGPNDVSEAQKEMHEQAMAKRLEQINMTQADSKLFRTYLDNVRREVRELRVILESIEAKNKERVWLKNQTSGDLDDTKIIEGLTGEHNIYKKRGDDDPEIGLFQEKPKRMNFVFDLSASMFRFNGHDRRLERSMEVALMLMESFRGFEHKFQYRILGHSGDGANIEFVTEAKYPKSEKEEFEIISKMRAHSQYCLSGDNTLGAAAHAIKHIVKDEADDYFVVVLSDANIAQYNIKPKDIARILKSDDRVTAQMVFIGSLQDQAEQ